MEEVEGERLDALRRKDNPHLSVLHQECDSAQLLLAVLKQEIFLITSWMLSS